MLNFNKSLLLSLSCLILLTACTLTVEPDDDTIDDDKTVDVDVDITNIQTNGAPNIPDDAGYDSFHAVAEDSNNSTINILTLPALAVQSTNGTSKSISKILDPVAQITFNESNVLTGASIYVGDNNHTISGTGTDTSLWQQADDGLYINATRTFARGNGDTDARYVMGIDWYQPNNSSDTIEDIIDEFGIGGGTGTRGYLVTGFETDGGQIPNNNDATFSGSGKGYYKNSVNVIIQTKFDVTANVAFANQTMNLEATNTQSCLYALSFTLCSEALNNLNFTSTLSYDAGENNLSGDVASNGMIGTTQARFYGNGDDAATELGGTFLMSGSSRYYHGYFLANTGSYAGDTTIITPTQPIEDTITKPTEDFKGIAGFNDANRNGVTDIALPVSVVEVNYRNNLALVASYSTNIPTNNKINDAMVEFSYDDDGNFVAVNTNNHGLKLYLDTKTYGVHDVNGRVFATDEIIGAYSPSYSSDNITSTDGDAPFYLALRRQSNSLGFTSNYMAKIGWFKIVNATTTFGYGITGFETSEDVFPVTGRKIIFKGKGRGIYGDAINSPEELQFDVTANVNFNRRLIALKGENTCYSFDLCDTRAQFLDFKGNLIYEA
ncbi:MAG: hypothetical protein K0U39_07495, partial [Alphaproteobacteria bacterium]|nr:hypothetical protein [Alphaproteobacteria bacterium]